jgi:hypothetical protein
MTNKLTGKFAFITKSVTAIAFATALMISSFAVPQQAEAGKLNKILGAGLAIGAGALILNELHKQDKANKQYNNHQHKKQYKKKRYYKKKKYNNSVNQQQSLSRAEVREVQFTLNDWGFNAGYVDGQIGRQTRRAIRDYQSSRGQRRTGYLTNSQRVDLLGY